MLFRNAGIPQSAPTAERRSVKQQLPTLSAFGGRQCVRSAAALGKSTRCGADQQAGDEDGLQSRLKHRVTVWMRHGIQCVIGARDKQRDSALPTISFKPTASTTQTHGPRYHMINAPSLGG